MPKEKLHIFDWDGTVTLPGADEALVFHPNFMAMIDSLILDRQRNGTERVVVTNGEIADYHLKIINSIHEIKAELEDLVEKEDISEFQKLSECFEGPRDFSLFLKKNGIGELSDVSEVKKNSEERVLTLDAKWKEKLQLFMKNAEKIYDYFIGEEPCRVYFNVNKPLFDRDYYHHNKKGLSEAWSLQAGQDSTTKTNTEKFFTKYEPYFQQGKKVVMFGNSVFTDVALARNLKEKFPEAEFSAVLLQEQADYEYDENLPEKQRSECLAFKQKVDDFFRKNQSARKSLIEEGITVEKLIEYTEKLLIKDSDIVVVRVIQYAIEHEPSYYEEILRKCYLFEYDGFGKKQPESDKEPLKGQFATIPRESEDGKVDKGAINKSLSLVGIRPSYLAEAKAATERMLKASGITRTTNSNKSPAIQHFLPKSQPNDKSI